MSLDSATSADAAAIRGKKRGRKPKGSNVPGSKSLSKMSATRMDDYDDDDLDRSEFLQITKKDSRTGKLRKLQECPLDNSLSYRQKVAGEEITYLFP